jgi:DNA-binding MarR family transcriptional regulator
MDHTDSIARATFLIERIGRLIRVRQTEGGLNPAQWDALRYLVRANRFSRSPTAVAAFLATTKGTVSQTLIALEAKGLVRKSVNEDDRRGARLEATEAGAKLVKTADPMAHLASALAELPPLHATLIAQALSRVLDALLEQNGRRAFEACASCRHFRRDAAPGRAEGPHHCGLVDAPLTDTEADLLCIEHEAA